MARAICAALAAAFAATTLAQSFVEGFDTGPDGWIGGANKTFGLTPGGDPLVFASGEWYALNISSPLGTTGWFCDAGGFDTYAGNGFAVANYNGTGSVGDIDEYLMSPVRTLNNGDTISFWTRVPTGSSFPDRLAVKLSTSGSSTPAANFDQTLLTINPTLAQGGYPEVWTQFTLTLSGLPGEGVSGRFAFNYNVTNGGASAPNSNFIAVDEVAYTAVPEPATLVALGLGALLAARRRRRA